MTLPRVSIKSILILVAVFAVQCMALRSVHSRSQVVIPGWVHFLTWIGLPMLNVLVLALLLTGAHRAQARLFWLGFQAAGWVALVANLVWCLVWPDPYAEFMERAMEPIIALLGRWLPVATAMDLVFGYLAYGLILSAQILIAVVGGWLTSRSRVGAEPADLGTMPQADQPPCWSRFARPVVALALIAFPTLAIERFIAGIDDSEHCRLAPGSMAIMRPAGQTGAALLKLKGFGPVPVGSRVRVEADDDTTQLFSVQVRPGKPQFMGDMRKVHVTLLEGDNKGQTTTLARAWLRPAEMASRPDPAPDRPPL